MSATAGRSNVPPGLVRRRDRWGSDPGTHREVYTLIGEYGAVTFVYADLDANASPELLALCAEITGKLGKPLFPMAFGLDAHHYLPVENGSYREQCDLLNAPCWMGKGTILGAQRLLDQWIARDRDDEWLWARLHEYYYDWLEAE